MFIIKAITGYQFQRGLSERLQAQDLPLPEQKEDDPRLGFVAGDLLDQAKGALEQAAQQISQADQERKLLGLSDTFIQTTLVSRSLLAQQMGEFFDRSSTQAKEELKEAGLDDPAIVADFEDDLLTPVQTTSLSEAQRLFSVSDSTNNHFADDLNWPLLGQLPILGLNQSFPKILQNIARPALDCYNLTLRVLVRMKKCSERLGSYLANVESSRKQFVFGLKDLLGYQEGKSSSNKWKYYQPAADIQVLLKLAQTPYDGENLEDLSSFFSSIQGVAANALEKIDKALKLESVEAYIRMQAFLDYADYIDENYRHLKTDEHRSQLKIEIAKALSIDHYIADIVDSKTGKITSARLQSCIEGLKARQMSFLIKDAELRQVLTENVGKLVAQLHQEQLITETHVKTGFWKSQVVDKELRYYKKVAQYNNQNSQSCFSVQNTSKSISAINATIYRFVTKLVQDAVIVEEDFQQHIPSYTEQKNNWFTRGSVFQMLTQQGFDSEKQSPLAGFGRGPTRSILKRLCTFYPAGISHLKAQDVLNLKPSGVVSLDRFLTNYLFLKNEIGVWQSQKLKLKAFAQKLFRSLDISPSLSPQSLERKLLEVADQIQKPMKKAYSKMVGRSAQTQTQAQELKRSKLCDPEQVCEYLSSVVQQELANQVQILREKHSELLQELALLDDKQAIEHKISEMANVEQSIDLITKNTAKLSKSLFQIYQTICDPDKEGSIAKIIEEVKVSLQEGVCSAAKIQQLEQTFQSIKETLDKISPSLSCQLEQHIAAIKTYAAVSAQKFIEVDKADLAVKQETLAALRKDHSRQVKTFNAEQRKRDSHSAEKANQCFEKTVSSNLSMLAALTESSRLLKRRIEDLNQQVKFKVDPELMKEATSAARLSTYSHDLHQWQTAFGMHEQVVDLVKQSMPADLGRTALDDEITIAIDVLQKQGIFSSAEAPLSIPASALIPNQVSSVKGPFFDRFKPAQVASFVRKAYRQIYDLLSKDGEESTKAQSQFVEMFSAEMKEIENAESLLDRQMQAANQEMAQMADQKKKINSLISIKKNALRFEENHCKLYQEIGKIDQKIAMIESTLVNADLDLSQAATQHLEKQLSDLNRENEKLYAQLNNQFLQLISQVTLLEVGLDLSKIDNPVILAILVEGKINEIESLKEPQFKYQQLAREKTKIQERKQIVMSKFANKARELGFELRDEMLLQSKMFKARLDKRSQRIQTQALTYAFKIFGFNLTEEDIEKLRK